jgi:hypothetical protein
MDTDDRLAGFQAGGDERSTASSPEDYLVSEVLGTVRKAQMVRRVSLVYVLQPLSQ